MSDLSVSNPRSEFDNDEQPSDGSLWLSIKKAASRLSDWFVIQSHAVKLLLVADRAPDPGHRHLLAGR